MSGDTSPPFIRFVRYTIPQCRQSYIRPPGLPLQVSQNTKQPICIVPVYDYTMAIAARRLPGGH